MDDERRVRRAMEQLAERGLPRGADDVLAAARRRAAVATGWPAPTVTAVAIAASVLLIGGMAGAVFMPSDDEPRQKVAGPTTTGPVPTTTESAVTTTAAPPAVTVPARVVAASRLEPFRNWNAFLGYVKPKGVEVVGPAGLPGIGRFGTAGGDVVVRQSNGTSESFGTADEGGTSGTADSASVQAATDPYSHTNIQEEGVDEPDLAKTNGRTIFTLVDSMQQPPASPTMNLRAITGTGTARLLGSLPVPGVQQILLVGDRVVALGTDYPATADGRGRVHTVIAVIDVTRPGAMRLASRMEVEGTFLSARLVAGVPRIVIKSFPDDLPMAYPTGPSQEDADRAQSQNRDVIRGSGIDDWVPAWTMTEGPRKGRSGRLVNYDQLYRPPVFSGFGMLSVLTLDMGDPSNSQSAGVMADGDIVYGSATRIYVATNGWGRAVPLEAGGFDVRPVSETLVHDFDISAPERAVYRVSGKVKGVPLNQFSMSEHAGYLRIATTASLESSESFVSVLADRGQALVEVGQVGGLGKGERIQAVRFIGTTGYVVTFRQVDPLYIVDVSDPTKPRVRGELKVLGYSAYLHPVGDGLLLGVGVAATEEGRRQGVQASLFDVSDPGAPELVQQHVLGNGFSDLEFDHHAFLWWAPTQLAVFPVNHNEGSPESSFVGAVGLRLDSRALTEVGRIQHPAHPDDGGYAQPIMRSLVIGDRLYTVSFRGLRQSDLGSLAKEAWVPFQ